MKLKKCVVTILMMLRDDNSGAHNKNDGTEWYVDKTKQVK